MSMIIAEYAMIAGHIARVISDDVKHYNVRQQWQGVHIRFTPEGLYGPTWESRPRHRPIRVVRCSWNGRVGPIGWPECHMGPLDCMQYGIMDLSLAV